MYNPFSDKADEGLVVKMAEKLHKEYIRKGGTKNFTYEDYFDVAKSLIKITKEKGMMIGWGQVDIFGKKQIQKEYLYSWKELFYDFGNDILDEKIYSEVKNRFIDGLKLGLKVLKKMDIEEDERKELLLVFMISIANINPESVFSQFYKNNPIPKNEKYSEMLDEFYSVSLLV